MNTLLITLVGLIGFYLTGQKKAWGWLVGILSQLMWVWYAFQVHDLQILVPSAVYGAVYGYCFRQWTKK
jgi:nicotinamide riboside transporter PnuC